MRVLVVSDIHSNLDALDAVLADAGQWDVLWSLGDVVGYGPQPNECIARLSEHEHLAIPGNHDWGVLEKLDLAEFNADARQANLWTRNQLSAVSRAYLEALPSTRVGGDVTLAHGSPRYPIWEYLIHASSARVSFAYFHTSICLVGHTHLPVIFRFMPSASSTSDSREGRGQNPPVSGQCQASQPVEGREVLQDQQRYIINPGSVGQPRDGDPRAAYLLFDPERKTIEHRRVVYDIEATQKKMRRVDLPPRQIARLAHGW